jgi:uncharacterized protein involved in cysteine biosynthesis
VVAAVVVEKLVPVELVDPVEVELAEQIQQVLEQMERLI